MGLFDFVKGAGRAIFGGDDEKPAAEVAGQPAGPSAEEIANARRLQQAARLEGLVRDMGFEVEDFDVKIEGDTAIVAGSVSSQGDREKIILTVGNTAGIARVDDRITVTTPEPEATFYTVQRGDTLSGIAKAQYGKGSKYMVIFEANKPMLEDPDKIYPGQVLRIPPLED